MVVVWLIDNIVGRINEYAMSCRISTVLVTVHIPFWYLTKPPGQLSLAILPWVGMMSTGDGYDHCWGRKQQVLHNSRPSYQDFWHAGNIDC